MTFTTVIETQALGSEGATVHTGSEALRSLQRQMLEITTTAETKRDALSGIVSVLAEHVQPAAVFYFERDQEGRLAVPLQIYPPEAEAHADQLAKQLCAICEAACQQGETQVNQQAVSGGVIAATPIVRRGGQPEAIGAIFPASALLPDCLLMLMQIAASHLVLWHVLDSSRDAEVEAHDTAALLELLTKLEQAPDLRHTCYTLVNELQEFLQCQHVAVGLQRPGQKGCHLKAISGMGQLDEQSQATQAIEAALDEAVLRDEITAWPPSSDRERHATIAHKKLCTLYDAQGAVSTPLRNLEGHGIGALIALDSQVADTKSRTVRLFQAGESSLAAALDVMQRLEGGRVTRLVRKAKQLWHNWKGKAAVVTICCVLVAMLVPWSYKIKCNCQLEPVMQRFVAAPFEGTLEKSLVKPGDVVKEGQVLARMDGREIRWKQAGVLADQSQAAKKRDSTMAAHEYAEAQIAKLEMDRLDLEIRLLDHRAENLEIKSPVGGIVTSGDLERAEGAPLVIGQTLFEIAPLEKMIVEVAIADDEVPYVREGQQVVVRLDAYPFRTWQAVLTKVQPRSEIRDQDNVFIGEATLDNDDGLLRPGMKGRAKIATGLRPVGWILFHKPWEYLTKKIHW